MSESCDRLPMPDGVLEDDAMLTLATLVSQVGFQGVVRSLGMVACLLDEGRLHGVLKGVEQFMGWSEA
ncbi:MAG: hypothetical protein K9N51_13430 [Candidatus Pacebacteria bacterium]|nr:hypothetical protein [Candidatus Paceibacterota bacterium]